MAGIFTRPALDKIMNNADLTPEQRTEQVFSLYGRALDDGFISKSAAEDAKNSAVEAAKASFKAPDPVDPKTTPEYMELLNERDMLRAIGGDDFARVKPKFREQVYGMLERGDNGFKTGKGWQEWTPEQMQASNTGLREYLIDYVAKQKKNG